ncbi:YsnF/AvaK domain-containing protein, partial [Dyadobacter sp.]
MSTENNSEKPDLPNAQPFLPHQPLSIPLIREVLIVDKKTIQTGKVLVSKKNYEDPVSEQIELSCQKVIIERRQINEYVESAPPVRYENGVTIIAVIKEVLVTEKRLMLVEEIHICPQTTT